SVASGASGTFPIDNTKGGLPAIPAYCGSPYSDGTVLLRGQLHCHSYPDNPLVYDGSGQGPEFTLYKYMLRGYDFLAVTDHDILSPGSMDWPGWAPRSVEITHMDSHVVAVGTSATELSQLDFTDAEDKAFATAMRITQTHNRSGLAFIAHPDSRPYAFSAKELYDAVRTARPDGIGIWTPGNDSQRSWDKLVYALGKPVWGYVEDDYHPDTLSNHKAGLSWLGVPGSQGESWDVIKEKLRAGNYYCYYTTDGKWPGGTTPPQMRVTVSNSGSQPLISVAFDRPMSSIEFYGYDWGFFKKLQGRGSGSSDSYQATGREKFVRVMACYHFGGTLWMTSQPIVINKEGNYSPYESNGARVMSTSPELILAYVDADSKPLAPPSGYVGDVFDVTTANGQLPPNATLQLSYGEEDIAPLGGTRYLAIYRYRDQPGEWVKVGGTVDPGTQSIESAITALGKYCISADLPVDTTVPQVFIDNPPYGASVASNTTVKATVNDDLGAWRVRFYLNDHLLAEDADSSDGWGAALKVSDYCTGDWTLKAEAEDLAGNVGTAEIPIYVNSTTPR
ncbi:MAG: Ig-like domain-containing protein, partial [Chloroflexi bacterium]|nr:Ig-like domain-containing protein [Chloroflexota bacterium]